MIRVKAIETQLADGSTSFAPEYTPQNTLGTIFVAGAYEFTERHDVDDSALSGETP